jgi:hypothetical protein
MGCAGFAVADSSEFSQFFPADASRVNAHTISNLLALSSKPSARLHQSMASTITKTQSGSISVLIGASNLIWVPSLIKVLYENVSDAILTMSKRVFGTLLSQLETRQV